MKKKHGQEAYTIFRLLLKQRGPVETDEVIFYAEDIALFCMFSDTLYMQCINDALIFITLVCSCFFLLFTLLQTSEHDARLPSKFADY